MSPLPSRRNNQRHKETVTTQENDPHQVPVRMCIGCRTRRPQAELVRCTMGGDGPIICRTSHGRGAWLCSIECFDTAVRRRAFTRAWKRDVPSATLDKLRIPFECAVTNMRESTAAGTSSGTPMPTKG